MDRGQWIQIGFSMAGAVSTVALSLLWRMVRSIEELNTKMAVILERVDSHEKRIDKLEND